VHQSNSRDSNHGNQTTLFNPNSGTDLKVIDSNTSIWSRFQSKFRPKTVFITTNGSTSPSGGNSNPGSAPISPTLANHPKEEKGAEKGVEKENEVFIQKENTREKESQILPQKDVPKKDNLVLAKRDREASRSTLQDYLDFAHLNTKSDTGLKRSASSPADISLLIKPAREAISDSKMQSYSKKVKLPLRRVISTLCYETQYHPFSRIIKEGILQKKNDVEVDGKRARVRSWRASWIVLRGFNLICYTGDLDFKGSAPPSASLRMEKSIYLKDCLTFPEDSYTKRNFVFRLITGQNQSFLFQADSLFEMSKWMHAINHQAAVCTMQSLDKQFLPLSKKIKIFEKKVQFIQKKVDIEAAYKSGIDKLIEHYRTKNKNAYMQAYNQFQKWEERMSQLLEERKKFVSYLGLLEDMTMESLLCLEYHSPFTR